MKYGLMIVVVAACGGKDPASSNDCASAVEAAVTIGQKAAITGQAPSDKTIDALKKVALDHCVADHWSTEVTTCLKSATTNGAINTCLGWLPPALRTKWQTAMAAELARTPLPTGSGSGSGSGSAAAELPAECGEYKALMERLANCSSFPKAQREAYEQAYKSVIGALAAAQNDAGRAQMVQGCKTTVDVIRQSAAATCGW